MDFGAEGPVPTAFAAALVLGSAMEPLLTPEGASCDEEGRLNAAAYHPFVAQFKASEGDAALEVERHCDVSRPGGAGWVTRRCGGRCEGGRGGAERAEDLERQELEECPEERDEARRGLDRGAQVGQEE